MDGTIINQLGVDQQGVDQSGIDRSGGLAGEREGTPRLDLAGFIGPLDHLLTLARAHEIDLARISVIALVDQLAAALQQAPPSTPLGQKADWVVMTAWLVQLRSRLLLPEEEPAQQSAAAEAADLRDRLVDLRAMQALARWLEDRPQIGRDVFARGQPEDFAAAISGEHQVDVVGFLWASLALFDDADDVVDTAVVYRPPRPVLHSALEARARILRLLAAAPEGGRFEQFLPDMPDVAGGPARTRRLRRSAWGSTFIASLELAKQGALTLAQEGLFTPIHFSAPPAEASAQRSDDGHRVGAWRRAVPKSPVPLACPAAPNPGS
jgi:segregation and condensation protein A